MRLVAVMVEVGLGSLWPEWAQGYTRVDRDAMRRTEQTVGQSLSPIDT